MSWGELGQQEEPGAAAVGEQGALQGQRGLTALGGWATAKGRKPAAEVVCLQKHAEF